MVACHSTWQLPARPLVLHTTWQLLQLQLQQAKLSNQGVHVGPGDRTTAQNKTCPAPVRGA
jgi:hypothetical protein